MKIDGRCHCGYVTFEAEANPETTTICNCTDCLREFTGTLTRTDEEEAEYTALRARLDAARELLGPRESVPQP